MMAPWRSLATRHRESPAESIWLTPEEQLSADYLGTAGQPGNFSKIMKDTADFLQRQKSIDHSPSQEEFDAFINSSYIEMSLK